MFDAPDIDVVDFLIMQGLSIHDVDNRGSNMIMTAKSNHHMIKDLIKRGLNINHVNDFKKNALFNSSLKKLEVLLECNINIHQLSKMEENCAFYNSYQFCFDEEKLVKKLKLMKEAGVDLTIEDKRGKNIFERVKSHGEIEFLLKEGVNRPDYNLKSYLSSADIQKIKMIEEIQMKITIDKERETILGSLENVSIDNELKKRRI